MNHSKILKFCSIFLLYASILLSLVSCGDSTIDEQLLLSNARSHIEKGDIVAASIELRNLLKSNPDNGEARFILGTINLDLGMLDDAEKEFRRAAKAGWNDEEVQINIARTMLAKNEFQKLLDEIKTRDSWSAANLANLHAIRALALANLGDMSQAESTLAEARSIKMDAFHVMKTTVIFQLSKGKTAESLKTLSQSLSIYPDDSGLFMLKAAASVQSKDFEKASEIYQSIIKQESNKVISADGRKARISLAQLQILNNKLSDAEATLKPLYNRNNKDPEANYLGGVIAFGQNDYPTAEIFIRKILDIAPNHGKSLFLMGKIKYALQDYDQAAKHLSTYLSRSPQDTTARQLLVHTYLALKQPEQAKSTLQPALAESPDNTILLTLESKIEFSRGNTTAGIEAMVKAVRANPDNATLRHQLAKAYILTGNTGQAIKEINSFEKLSGKTEEAEKLRIITYETAGQYKNAISIAEQMLRKNPTDPALLSLNGSLYAASGNELKARNHFDKALSIQPGFISAATGLARIEQAEGNYIKAVNIYKDMIASSKGGIIPMLSLAEIAQKQGHIDQMLDWLEKARESDPAAIRPRTILSIYYLANQEPNKAEKLMQEALKIAPDNLEIIALQSRVLMHQKRYNEALTPLNTLIEKSPNSVNSRILLGGNYLRLNMLDNAREQLSTALELDPENALVIGQLSEIELLAGNLDKSLVLAKHLQQSTPPQSHGYMIEGKIHNANKHHKKAILALQKAWDIQQTEELAILLHQAMKNSNQLRKATSLLNTWLEDHPDSVKARLYLALAYQKANLSAQSISAYEHVLDNEPNNSAALNNLAWLYSKQGNPKALGIAEKAYRNTPGDPSIQDTYGWILTIQGQAAKGKIMLKDALKKLPDSPEVRYHYAAALMKSGNKQDGWQLLDELLNEDKVFEGIEDAKQLHSTYASMN